MRDVGDISVGEMMSGVHHLISLRILVQGSKKGVVSIVNIEESWLEIGVEIKHQVMWKNYGECWP